jgi:tRNA A-37 threonylcarbamoyl transferase component Bud32
LIDDTPTYYHFKAVQDHHSFLREFRILLQLREKRLNKKYRLPTIHGLVYYSDKPNCIMGMLLNHIDNEDTLANWIEMRSPPRSLKEKWNRQIKDTVRALHRHGMVWGDVKPDNALIDREQNSWLIDFGGGYNSGYVDKDVVETIEGDLQGVSRMEETLLQRRRFPVHGDASFDRHD